jgi:hypothetical protein
VEALSQEMSQRLRSRAQGLQMQLQFSAPAGIRALEPERNRAVLCDGVGVESSARAVVLKELGCRVYMCLIEASFNCVILLSPYTLDFC